jgi:hypothetical protein
MYLKKKKRSCERALALPRQEQTLFLTATIIPKNFK